MKLPVVKTPVTVRFTDIDPLGHVSNSIYPQFLDMGRIDLYHAIEAEIEKQKLSDVQPVNVVASLKIDFLSEVRLEHDVYVETWCEKIGNKSITLGQEIFTDGRSAAKATVILVGIDMESRESIVYPRSWQPSER